MKLGNQQQQNRVLVDRKEYMEHVDFRYDNPIEFEFVGYDLFMANFTIEEVKEVKKLHIQSRPRFDDKKAWKKYKPVALPVELVRKLADFFYTKPSSFIVSNKNRSENIE